MTARAGDDWAPSSVLEKYGMTEGPTTSTPTELNAIASPREGAAAVASPLNPENPLFWFGIIAATTFGLAAFSTNVRVGNAKAGLSIGDAK